MVTVGRSPSRPGIARGASGVVETRCRRRPEGKTALVAGGGNGIGRAIALGLTSHGSTAVVADKDEAGVRRVVTEMRAAGSHSEATDLLVLGDTEWGRILDVSLRGTFLCIGVACPRLIEEKRPGTIITVTSIGAFQPSGGPPAHLAYKGGVASVTRSAAISLAPHGIRVNALAPGYVPTDMTREGLDDPEIGAAIAEGSRSVTWGLPTISPARPCSSRAASRSSSQDRCSRSMEARSFKAGNQLKSPPRAPAT